jgi:hypothetical protein
MTKEDVINRLNELDGYDIEESHWKADAFLLVFLNEIGYQDVTEAWERARDRVGFWYA